MNFFEAIRIHFRLGLIILFLVPTITWIITLNETPIYESTARLLIEAKDLGFRQGTGAQPFQTVARMSDPIQTQIEILRSATILDKVIRQFNLRYRSGPNKGRYLEYSALSNNLTVGSDRNVDILELKFKSPNPKRAHDILQAIADSYIAKTIELKASDTASAIRFLKKERNRAEREALDASNRLKIFEKNSKVVGLDADQELVKMSFRLAELQLKVESEYVNVKTTADQLEQQLMVTLDTAVLSSSIGGDPFLVALRKDLYERQAQLLKFQTKVKPGHFQLEELKQQIEGDQKLIKERIVELVGEGIDPSQFPEGDDRLRSDLVKVYLTAKAASLSAKEQLDVIQEFVNDTNNKLKKLPNEKYIYTQLLRQNDIAKKRLEEIDMKLIESRMQGVIASHITNIRLLDPPSVPSQPKWPNVHMALLSSFIFGLCLAAIVIYLVEYFDDVIKGVDTLPKELNVPFLGQLPQIHPSDLPISYKEPRSEYTESIHSLRTNLSFLSLSGDRKVLLITSSTISEGKTSIAVNLAITYAQSGRRVLLVDTDIRNPSLYKYLARPKDAVGISNTLINEIDFYDVVQKSVLGIVGFDYLPGGDVPPNPVQLLESSRMRELLETSKHIYDLVILDSPPVGLFSDALLLARYADVVTLVARYNSSSRKELIAAVDLLNKANVTSIGIVLNAVPTGTMSYGYGYGYGYGSQSEDESLSEGQSAA